MHYRRSPGLPKEVRRQALKSYMPVFTWWKWNGTKCKVYLQSECGLYITMHTYHHSKQMLVSF